MTEQTNNKPESTIELGDVQAAIWRKHFDDGGSALSFTIQRQYYDKDKDEYQSTSSFRRKDLTLLEILVEKLQVKLKGTTESETETAETPESFNPA